MELVIIGIGRSDLKENQKLYRLGKGWLVNLVYIERIR